MNATTNYQLNQWEADDRVQRVDFNADNARIEAALSDLEARVALLDRAVPNMAYYLGVLGSREVLDKGKYIPARCMRNECFLFSQYLTLSGGAALENNTLTVPGGGQVGCCVLSNVSLDAHNCTQARLWLHHESFNPVVKLNGQTMTTVGSSVFTVSARNVFCQEQEYMLELDAPIQSAQITLEWKSSSSNPAKIYDYTMFFF